MTTPLSNAAESYIARAVAAGAYPSREAVLEAAVAALLERDGDSAEVDSYGTIEMTPEECDRLQREALAKAGRAGSKSGGYTIPEQR